MNHISIEASRALASHLGIPQEDDPLAWKKSISQQLEEMLDRQMELIAILDLMDGDPDNEENGDEADQSYPEGWRATSQPFEDAEDDDPSEESDPDHGIDDVPHDDEHMEAEPDLGWPEDIKAKPDPEQGWITDREEDILDQPHDGDADFEPDVRFHGEAGKRAAAKLEQRRAARKADQSKGLFHGLDPRHLPERYVMQAVGNCLEPKIMDGSRLEFSSTERPMPGDFVAIYRDAAFVKPGDWQVVVKELVMDCRKGDLSIINFGKGVLAKMLNPPRHLAFHAHEVIAVHKVVRVVGADEHHDKMTAADALALAAKAKVPVIAKVS
ncbi:hypothetical protein [Devosia sp.]|uniref:hypothetical protein n=1 Tax=Devosia sp. TaxID=1871048 RepID=UPI001AC89506|nr:hypothetical protein [Devosia sp.]MBN9335388.1 hypothetical protein [Devosia sp.]